MLGMLVSIGWPVWQSASPYEVVTSDWGLTLLRWAGDNDRVRSGSFRTHLQFSRRRIGRIM